MLDKTEKGRDEIATRGYKLVPRLRTLLLLVDGKTSRETLIKNVAGLGLREEHLEELIIQGFVAAEMKLEVGEIATALGIPPASEVSTPDAGIVEAEANPGVSDSADLVKQIHAAHQFYNESIKEYIGLRGIGLQLKVERAATLEDYRALRRPFLDAVAKHKGEEVARGLHKRLHMILYKEEQAVSLGGT